MLSAEAYVPTDRAVRYLEQLCSHLGAMQHIRHLPAHGHDGGAVPRVEHIEQSEQRAVVRFAEGCWILEAQSDALSLRVEADSSEMLEQLKAAITARITKIGRRDGLTVDWSTSPDAPREPGVQRMRSVRRVRWPRIGWFALAALAVAIHVGLVGSLFGGGRSKDIAADAIIALIVVKLALIGLQARSRRGREQRRSGMLEH